MVVNVSQPRSSARAVTSRASSWSRRRWRISLPSPGRLVMAPLLQTSGVSMPRRSAVRFASRYQRVVASTTFTPLSRTRRTVSPLRSLTLRALFRSVPSRSRAIRRIIGRASQALSCSIAPTPEKASALTFREAQVALPQANEPLAGEYDVVQHVDFEERAGLADQLPHRHVIAARRRVARGGGVDG